MKKQFLYLLLLGLLCSIGSAWGETTYKPYLAEGFEGSTTLTGSSCTANNTTDEANASARTGSKVCYAFPSSASSSARYIGVGANKTADKDYYIHAIVWVKGDNVKADKVQHNIGPYGTSPATTYANTTTSYTRFAITPYKSGGSSKQIRLYFISNNGTPVAHFWYDDFIMYLSSEDVATDLTKPSQATAATANTSSISWTNGSDTGAGATGIQNTLIFHRTQGSIGANDLNLNDQGIYSLTATEGPKVVGNWTLLSASVASDATSYSGTFDSGHEYAIVHRDLAYNYSTPTYVVATGETRVGTTTAITSESKDALNVDLKNGSAAGILVANVTETVGGESVTEASVTWSSSDESVATIGSSTGVVTLIKEGNTTITASFAATSTHAASSDTYDITITDSRTDPGISFETSIVNKIIGNDDFTNNLSNENGVTITYTISDNGTGTTINPSNGLVSLGINQGTETITATSSADPTYKSVIATYTLNVGMSAISNKYWDFSSWETGAFDIIKAMDNIELVAASGKNMEISSNNAQEIDDESFTKRLKLNGTGASTSRYVHFKVKPNTKISVYQYSGDADRKVKVDAGSFGGTNLLSEGNSGYVKMSCIYTGVSETDIYLYSSNSNISIYGIKLEPVVPIVISSATWASFSNVNEIAIPDGLTAYYAQMKDEETISLKEITSGYIPASTGVIVSGEANTYYANPTSTSASLAGANILQPWLTAGEPSEETYYTLAVDGDNNPMFKQSTGGTLAAGKAYLVLPAGLSAPSIIRIADEDQNATNIENLDGSVKTVKFIENGRILILRDGITYDALGHIVK